MPPQPLVYQGHDAIAAFLRHARRAAAAPRCASCRPAPTPSPPWPATCPDPEAGTARPYGMIVLTLTEDAVKAITWFGDPAVLERFPAV